MTERSPLLNLKLNPVRKLKVGTGGVDRRPKTTYVATCSRDECDECKENKEPVIGEADEEEEVFFGIITDREKLKMAKLRRRTEVFVANFRNESETKGERWNESQLAYSSSNSSSSHDSLSSSIQSPPACHQSGLDSAPKHLSSRLPRLANVASSSGSPSIHAHQAAAKIQTWFRLSRQAQEYQGVMNEVQELEDKTDDFLLEIRREKERIRLCSTPEQGSLLKDEEGKLDAVSQSSPVVIVPSHKPHLVEAPLRQDMVNTGLQESTSSAQLSDDEAGARHAALNATDDKSTNTLEVFTRQSESTLHDSAAFCPVKCEELYSKSCLTDSEVTHASTKRTATTVIQFGPRQDDHTPPQHSYFSPVSEYNASISSTPSVFVQSDYSCQTKSSPFANSAHHETVTIKDCSISGQTDSPHHTLLEVSRSIGGTFNTPLNVQVDNWTALGSPLARHSHLQHLELNRIATPSSFSKIDFQQTQSPTIFSSPRLFPMLIQAVQSQQPVPSASVFSPCNVTSNKPSTCMYGSHHSETLTNQSFNAEVHVSESHMTPQPVERKYHQSNGLDELVLDFEPRKLEPVTPVLNTAALRETADNSHHSINNFTTTSAPVRNFPMSPNVSVRKRVQNAVIDSPCSAENLPVTSGAHGRVKNSESGCMKTPRADSDPEHRLVSSEALAKTHTRIPAPVVLRETQAVTSSSMPISKEQQKDVNSPSRGPAGGQSNDTGMASANMGPRNSESGCNRLELLEQKKAELARIRAQKADLKQTLKEENTMCFAMKQQVRSALRSNVSHGNIPVHLFSLGCQGVSSLTLTDEELDIVTRLHTIRNSRGDSMQGARGSSRDKHTCSKGSVHLRWHSSLVTEIHCLSSPGHPVRVARPILAKHVGK